MRRERLELLEPLAVAGAVVLADLPLLGGRVLAGHDAGTWLTYGIETAANLREGLLFPAWAAGFNAGFGGPGLLFYPPLLHLVHAPLILAGAPPIAVATLVAVFLHLASGLLVRGWLRAEGLAAGALGGALVYVLGPYRLVTLYERTALAEHAAFLLPPLLLRAASLRRGGRSLRVAVLAACLCALALTNLPAALLLGGTVAVVVVAMGPGPGRLLDLCGAGLLAGFLAAFALVSPLLSGRWLATDLWYGAGAGAFRPSANVLFSPVALDPGFNGRVSWAVAGTLALAALAWALLPRDGRRGRRTVVWAAVALAVFAASLPPAGPLWDAVPLLSRLQFPWRIAGPLTLAAAALAGGHRSLGRGVVVAGAAALLALPFAGRGAVPLASLPGGRLLPAWNAPAWAEGRAASGMAGLGDSGFYRDRSDLWFLPRTARAVLVAELAGQRPAGLGPIRGRPAALLGPHAAPPEPDTWRQASGSVRLAAPQGGRLVLHTLAFPGMTVRVDGRLAGSVADPVTGLLAVDLPAGAASAAWEWEPPVAVRAGRVVTLAAFGGWLLLLAAGLRRFIAESGGSGP